MSKKKFTEDDKNRNFVQVNRDFMMDIAMLSKENSNALTVFMFISQNMDGNNALCISMKALEEALNLSRSTLSRAVKYLKEKGWLCILKTGTSNVYIINPEIEWTSWANQKKYCQFKTNVIVTPSENPDFLKNPKASMRYKHIDDTFILGIKAKKQAFEAEAAGIKQDGNAISFNEETGEILEDLEDDLKEEEPYYAD